MSQRDTNRPSVNRQQSLTPTGWRIAEDDPRWYERGVFYELSTRAFFDSNGDGTGDLAGIVEKFDYLSWLGVDCLWLLPHYPSPLRDGGYDVADYCDVAPEFGSLDDMARLISAAHDRGMRILIDLVLNHTSDAHPWFVESRSSRDNPKADWYVWSDDDKRYADIRVIFSDSESSNWTWDGVRRQYYWHRFFHFQPDLNHENPEVRAALLDVVRFWLDLGVDGFRLDAVPYLFQREGTTGENLPETHEFLRQIRALIDAAYPNRVLIAEVNGWPHDVADYFGDGDECQMCFHFPLMPRMFMAIRREHRIPITEILAQTPPIPEGCQWGVFLRNHDELTLEMVSDEERDYMWAEYAGDPRMRKNLGIRRRLAPLVDNDRGVAELLFALLLSLPGAPVLYYGDEIGMGDNIYLGDRDTVRTPMQWTPDRNAGFSTADFARLYLPPLMDPVYGYAAVNVEASIRDPSSLLHWLRRMIAVRHQNPVFRDGFVRGPPGGQPVGARLPARRCRPRHRRGAVDRLCEQPLAFRPGDRVEPGALEGLAPRRAHRPFDVPADRAGGLPSHARAARVFLAPGRGALTVTPDDAELGALARSYLDRQSWFQLTVPGARLDEIELVRAEMLREEPLPLCRLLLRCRARHFSVFAGWRDVTAAAQALHGREGAIFGSAAGDRGSVLVYDALADDELALELFVRATGGREAARRVRPLTTAVSHASLVYDGRYLMKCYRVLEDAVRPELEVMMQLDAVGFNAILAPVAAWAADGFDLALVREYLPSALEGRVLALTSLPRPSGPGLRLRPCRRRHGAGRARSRRRTGRGGGDGRRGSRLGDATPRHHGGAPPPRPRRGLRDERDRPGEPR